MNSGVKEFLEDRGSTPNLPQAGSQFSAGVKTESGFFHSNPLPNSNVYFENNLGSSSTTAMSNSDISNSQIKSEPERINYVKAEPFDDSSNLGAFSFPNENNHEIENESGEFKASALSSNNKNNHGIEYESSEFKASALSSNVGNDSEKNKKSRKRSAATFSCDCKLGKGKRGKLAKRRKTESFKFVLPDLVNLNLPPCRINSVPEKKSFSCNLKSFEWEKLVEHEYVSKIDNNIKQTVNPYILLQNNHKFTLDKVMADFNNVFKEEKFKNRWHYFGPCLHGIVERNTPIDVYFEDPPYIDLVQELCNKLETSSCFYKLKLCRNDPRKPSIWITHKELRKLIHIRTSSDFQLQVECSRVMKFYLSLNPNLEYLVVYLYRNFKKFFILDFKCQFWLVVFFMQQKNLLPSVTDVRKAAQIKHHVFGWDCSLPEDYSYPTESVSLYSLLLGFFNFYKDFDFLNYIICPYLGHVIALSDMENLELCADKWSTYLQQIRDQIPFSRSESCFNLQDPTHLCCNLGKNVNHCSDINKLIAIWNRWSNALPTKMADFDERNRVHEILRKLINQVNFDLCYFSRYEKFHIRISKTVKYRVCRQKLNQSYFLEAIRKLMEFVFKLDLMNVAVSQNFKCFEFLKKNKSVAVERSYPIMHLEYCSSENTWHSYYMKEIIPDKGPVRIYLRCEIDLDWGKIDVYAQGEARFIGFLRVNFKNMMAAVLNQIILR